jgi:hypothetical protein
MFCGFAALNAIAETTRKRANFAARQASAFHRNGGSELEKIESLCRLPTAAHHSDTPPRTPAEAPNAPPQWRRRQFSRGSTGVFDACGQ